MTTSKQVKWQLQWAEWEEGVLSAAQLWDKTNATPLFAGTLADGEWPNPIRSWTMAGSAITTPLSTLVIAADSDPVVTDNDPSTQPWPTSLGTLVYYPSRTGPFKETAKANIDYSEVKYYYDTYNTRKTTFETAKTAYNTLKDAYNTAVASEKARSLDAFRTLFEAPITIPDRPCKPDQLEAFTGL